MSMTYFFKIGMARKAEEYHIPKIISTVFVDHCKCLQVDGIRLDLILHLKFAPNLWKAWTNIGNIQKQKWSLIDPFEHIQKWLRWSLINLNFKLEKHKDSQRYLSPPKKNQALWIIPTATWEIWRYFAMQSSVHLAMFMFCNGIFRQQPKSNTSKVIVRKKAKKTLFM